MLLGLFGFELVVEMSILPAITSDPYLDGRREPRGGELLSDIAKLNV